MSILRLLHLAWSAPEGRGGKVSEELQRALDFAVAREQEAEAFYKEWARTVTSETLRVMLGDLGAAEHDHGQMLAHITPADLLAKRRDRSQEPRVANELVQVEAPPKPSLDEVFAVAVRRKKIAAALYDRFAEWGGEVAPLFRALASDERSHQVRLEAIRESMREGPGDSGTSDHARG